MNDNIFVRHFAERDATAVKDLFIRVNRDLAPPGMEVAFEDYIQRSLSEEIDRISDYYRERNGVFLVAERTNTIVGMFGLEAGTPGVVELRRMYVDPQLRGLGLGRQLLARSEDEARNLAGTILILSTSDLQPAALGIYRSSGYREVRTEIAKAASNKTLGGGIRRFHFSKQL